MKHLILSLLVLGFSQSLQAKLNINSPSDEKNKNQLGCADNVSASHTKDVQQPHAPVVQAQDHKDVQRNVSATDKPSPESVSFHSNKDPQKETVANSQTETTFQKPTSTASVDDLKKQSERTPAQTSDQQILSTARFCIANFTRVSEQFSVICNGLRLSKLKDRGVKTISKVGHYLVRAGFTPLNCWSSGSTELSKLHIYCAYYKPQ